MATSLVSATQPQVLSFNSALESFRELDKTSKDSQKVRKSEDQLLAERKLAAKRRKASSSDGPLGGFCSGASSPPVSKGNDQLFVQHPADEACGGSFSSEKEPVVEADVRGLQDSHTDSHGIDLRAGHGSLEPPDAAAGGAASMGSLPSTWCIMTEYEVQPLARTRTGSETLPLPGGTWMQHTPQCAICTAEFGPFTRRHHCRKCGRNVCNVCSPYRVYLREPLAHPSKAETGPYRVCMGCHEPC